MRKQLIGAALVAVLVGGFPGAATATGTPVAAPTAPFLGDLAPKQECIEEPLGPLPPTTDPVGRAPCPGVRPGAYVQSEAGGCTFNFLFKGSDKRSYMGTAGHCILEEDGESVWRGARGPVARDATGKEIGHFVYAVLSNTRDFALIRLDKGVKAKASMCYWGGPTKMDKGEPTPGTMLRHFGQGLVYGDAIPARTGRIRSFDADTIYADGAAIFGDSGSGVIEEGGAARGILVNLQVIPDRGLIGITRLRPQLDRAGRLLKLKLALRTAPLAR